jgi:hypothetical protein
MQRIRIRLTKEKNMPTEPKEEGPGCLTIGELREAIKDLPADMPVALEIVPDGGEDGATAYADNGEVEEDEDASEKCFFITGYADEEKAG